MVNQPMRCDFYLTDLSYGLGWGLKQSTRRRSHAIAQLVEQQIHTLWDWVQIPVAIQIQRLDSIA